MSEKKRIWTITYLTKRQETVYFNEPVDKAAAESGFLFLDYESLGETELDIIEVLEVD